MDKLSGNNGIFQPGWNLFRIGDADDKIGALPVLDKTDGKIFFFFCIGTKNSPLISIWFFFINHCDGEIIDTACTVNIKVSESLLDDPNLAPQRTSFTTCTVAFGEHPHFFVKLCESTSGSEHKSQCQNHFLHICKNTIYSESVK